MSIVGIMASFIYEIFSKNTHECKQKNAKIFTSAYMVTAVWAGYIFTYFLSSYQGWQVHTVMNQILDPMSNFVISNLKGMYVNPELLSETSYPFNAQHIEHTRIISILFGFVFVSLFAKNHRAYCEFIVRKEIDKYNKIIYVNNKLYIILFVVLVIDIFVFRSIFYYDHDKDYSLYEGSLFFTEMQSVYYYLIPFMFLTPFFCISMLSLIKERKPEQATYK